MNASMALSVTLLAPKSSVTKGFFRMGAALRANNPPRGVIYNIRKTRFDVPFKFDKYEFSPATASFWLFNALRDHLDAGGRSQLIHSFFWGYFNLWRPWIHENDSSASQYLTEYYSFNSRAVEKLVKLSARILNADSCRSVIVWSKKARQGMIDDGVHEEKVRVVPPPMPLGERVSQAGRPFRITFVGRDYVRKGGEYALKAFRDLSNAADVKLSYVGSIDDPAWRNWAKSTPGIEYSEFLPNSALRERIYPETDLFVLPTFAETGPLTVLEAMSYGIPVLATDLPRIKELVDGYSQECTFEKGNYTEFLDKLLCFIGDERLRRRVGNGLKQIVASRFSPEKVNEKLLETYSASLS